MAHGADERAAFLAVLEQAPFITRACKKTGIARTTVYRWIHEDTEFAAKVRHTVRMGHETLGEAAYSVLHEKVKERNLPAATFVLTHYPSTYSVRRDGSDVEDRDAQNLRRDSLFDPATSPFCNSHGNLVVSPQTAKRLEKMRIEHEMKEIADASLINEELP